MVVMSHKKGFTLIELVVVITIIGILAAVALPRFIDLTEQSKTAAAQGACGGMRTAVTMSYANSAAGGTAAFPTLAQLAANTCSAGPCFEAGLPTNKRTGGSAVADGTAVPAPCVCGAPLNGGSAWYYNETTGQVWAGTDNCAKFDPCTI